MVSVSPRLRDSLDYEDPEETDPRLSWGFRSLSINSAEYEEHDPQDDRRAFAASPDPSGRRRRRQRKSDLALDHAVPFQYRTIADGDAFRLCVVLPGTGTAPVECKLIWESSKAPKKDYLCLSYCWETDGPHRSFSTRSLDESASASASRPSTASSQQHVAIPRDAAILLDGYRFPVTRSLLGALRSLRKPTTNLLIWLDQVCIDQENDKERGHQVSISTFGGYDFETRMLTAPFCLVKHIFSQAQQVIVWLGEADNRSSKLFEYAKKMRRGEETSSTTLGRILTPRQLQDSLQKLLQRPWFRRVWVIPEVALARRIKVACGNDSISWDLLVRLIRDVQLPATPGFDKYTALLGNPRQRIAILTQMAASQREGLLHTDITQLLILAKSSRATDFRDFIYALYGVTLLTTFPDYTRSIGRLYCDVAHMYVNSILYEEYYSRWHGLNDDHRTQQLMSVLYSAGILHQHYDLPSWIPDWTHMWYLASIWCKTTSNVVTGTCKDEWTAGVRSDYRAGGSKLETFEVINGAYGMHRLRLAVLIVDHVTNVSETTPASTPQLDDDSPISPDSGVGSIDTTLTYGRTFFETSTSLLGIATRGVQPGDIVAIVLGGDVPVMLRRSRETTTDSNTYKLLCECLVTSASVMNGDLAAMKWPKAQDIVLT